MKIFKPAILAIPLFAFSAFAQESYRPPPPGGAVIVPDQPIWLTGIPEEGSVLEDIASGFPERQSAEYFEIVNAGYYLAMRDGDLQAVYFFQLNIKTPFDKRVYTRVTLENPSDAENPIVYEHYLSPEERSTRAAHSPLTNVEANRIYELMFEVYRDPERNELIERITQPIQASFDNTGDCIEPSPEARPLLFGNITIEDVEIPIDKLSWPCRM